MQNRSVIAGNCKPIWASPRGHRAHRGGAGYHEDRRLRRTRTRADARRAAIRGQLD